LPAGGLSTAICITPPYGREVEDPVDCQNDNDHHERKMLDSMSRLEQVHQRLTPLRAELIDHSVYQQLVDLPALCRFMESHVFAVWDFMCLLKALQTQLCWQDIPWFPRQNGLASRLLNEICLGEESDEDGQGGYCSHFSLYHRAMCEAGAETRQVDAFLAELKADEPMSRAFAVSGAAPCVQEFVTKTFGVIEAGQLCAMAGYFLFGREDLLPDLFRQIVLQLNQVSDGKLSRFQYYLDRHIELDEGRHAILAGQLLETLCGDDAALWNQAEEAACDALRSRQALWDAVSESLAPPS
tara:strand:- start:264 stop:1157 length:894 start_codon:yes stop_codon:yes gene_type:complete